MKNKNILFVFVGLGLVLAVIIFYGYSISEKAAVVENESCAVTDTTCSVTTTAMEDSSVTAGPKLAVEPALFDFGDVIYGEVAEKNFRLKNVGKQPLEILRLSTSCGCTQAFMAEVDKIIAPGESVEMKVTFDPAVHKDDSDLGEVTRIVYIKTNDKSNPEAEVVIKANVIKY